LKYCHFKILAMCLTPRELTMLSATSRSFRNQVQQYRLELFDIEVQLKEFFRHPVSFRKLQFETGMLIGGLWALNFLGHFTCDNNIYLDLYAYSESSERVQAWFDKEGYRHQNTSDISTKNTQSIHPQEHIATVIGMKRKHASQQVNIFVTKYSPIDAILHNQSSKYYLPFSTTC
jgi:hypothetical protein